ncbi:alpha/beta hydrolase [Gordonia sp. KTR9]|uniref:alpha/beta hydrolase n=1 Tax=Gordonia sp. KTR9 TaxID=337191 RepID=UPI00027DD9CE|nr:alpha/beta hydrolase [Gordonia sp. KTR9]AFR46920.1 lysophospholipase [Gordonia sp. KTR9]
MSTEWLEPDANARGSVVVIAGRGEHADVYGRFARRIAFDGYRVTVVENARESVARALSSSQIPGPLVVVGSDSGAVTALDIAPEYPAVTGIVLAGLLVDGPPALPSEWDAELDARSACPVHRGVLGKPDAIDRGALQEATSVATPESLARVTSPVLLVHGDADTVSPVDPVLAASTALPDVRLTLVRGGRHDILNDVTHRSVAAEIVQFLERLREPGGQDLLRREPVRTLAS